MSDFAALVSLANGLTLRWVSGAETAYPVSRRDVRRTTPFFHLIVVVTGRLRVRLGDARPTWLGAGVGLLIAPHCVHDLDTECPTALCWADFQLSFFGIMPLTDLLDLPTDLPGTGIAEVQEAIRRMAALQAQPPRDRALALCAIHAAQAAFLQSIIGLGTWSHPGGQRDAAVQRLAPLIQAMSSRLGDAWSRAACARLARVGPTRLTALFIAATGLPPARFLSRMRLQAAQELLVTGDDTLSDIAGRLGFHDAFHFSKRFKQQVGVAPAHYRRAYRSQPARSGDAAPERGH